LSLTPIYKRGTFAREIPATKLAKNHSFALSLPEKEDMNSMSNRRTIRKYSSQEVPTDLLNNLLEVAFRSSTTGNMQLYSAIITRDAKMKELLAPAHYNQPAFRNAPALVTFCADFNRFTKWCEINRADAGYGNFQSFMNACMDTLIATQTFCVAAEEAGLGICYLGTTTYNPQDIIEVLQLPKLVFPLTTISIGYPDEQPEQPDRLPTSALVHEERYTDYSEEAIRNIYAYKEALPENQHFVAENHKETLAQVFTDIRYTKEENEKLSANFLRVLHLQGFL
jgi:nitroreductase